MRWFTIGILSLEACFATDAHGQIYHWEYIGPLHPELGRQQSSTFAIPEAVQSQGSGGDYQVGGMIVRPIPEPAKLVLGCVALSAFGSSPEGGE